MAQHGETQMPTKPKTIQVDNIAMHATHMGRNGHFGGSCLNRNSIAHDGWYGRRLDPGISYNFLLVVNHFSKTVKFQMFVYAIAIIGSRAPDVQRQMDDDGKMVCRGEQRLAKRWMFPSC